MQAPDTPTDNSDTSIDYPLAVMPTLTCPDVGSPSTAVTPEAALISTATSAIIMAADVDKKPEYDPWTVAERLNLILGIIGSVIAIGTFIACWHNGWKLG